MAAAARLRCAAFGSKKEMGSPWTGRQRPRWGLAGQAQKVGCERRDDVKPIWPRHSRESGPSSPFPVFVSAASRPSAIRPQAAAVGRPPLRQSTSSSPISHLPRLLPWQDLLGIAAGTSAVRSVCLSIGTHRQQPASSHKAAPNPCWLVFLRLLAIHCLPGVPSRAPLFQPVAEAAAQMADYDYLIKFLALGDSGVGKTSFLVNTFCISVWNWAFPCSIVTQTIPSRVNSYPRWALTSRRRKWLVCRKPLLHNGLTTCRCTKVRVVVLVAVVSEYCSNFGLPSHFAQ